MNHVAHVVRYSSYLRRLPKEFQIHWTVKFFDRLKPVGSRSYGSYRVYVVITSRTGKQDLAQLYGKVISRNERRLLYIRGKRIARYVKTQVVNWEKQVLARRCYARFWTDLSPVPSGRIVTIHRKDISDRTIVNDVRAGFSSQSRYHALAQQPRRENTETHIVNQAKISAVTLAWTKRRGALDKCQSSIKAYSRSQELPRTNWYMMLSQVGSTKSRVFSFSFFFFFFYFFRIVLSWNADACEFCYVSRVIPARRKK